MLESLCENIGLFSYGVTTLQHTPGSYHLIPDWKNVLILSSLSVFTGVSRTKKRFSTYGSQIIFIKNNFYLIYLI